MGTEPKEKDEPRKLNAIVCPGGWVCYGRKKLESCVGYEWGGNFSGVSINMVDVFRNNELAWKEEYVSVDACKDHCSDVHGVDQFDYKRSFEKKKIVTVSISSLPLLIKEFPCILHRIEHTD